MSVVVQGVRCLSPNTYTLGDNMMDCQWRIDGDAIDSLDETLSKKIQSDHRYMTGLVIDFVKNEQVHLDRFQATMQRVLLTHGREVAKAAASCAKQPCKEQSLDLDDYQLSAPSTLKSESLAFATTEVAQNQDPIVLAGISGVLGTQETSGILVDAETDDGDEVRRVSSRSARRKLTQQVKNEYEATAQRVNAEGEDTTKVQRAVTAVLAAFSHCIGVCSKRRLGFEGTYHFVHGRSFQIWVSVAILLNAVFIGLSSDYMMETAITEFRNQESFSEENRPMWMLVSDVLFNVIFVVELALRIVALEGQFLVGPEWRWNLMDVVLVMSSVMELLLIAFNFDLSFIRVLRLLRILRSFRVFQLLRWATLFGNLRLMLLAIMKSAVPFMWAVMVLLTEIFLFAVVFLHGISEYLSEAGPDDPFADDMQTYFGSMLMTLLTLFMSISGGVSWWEVMPLLIEVSLIYAFLFVFYVLVTVLAAMNIITGIFVNDAMEAARADKDLMMQLEQQGTKALMASLKSIFSEIDQDESNTITFAEFEKNIKRDEVRVIFHMLGIEVTDALAFFKVLDVDGDDGLEIEEFVMGCLRFKGNAKTIDIECHVLETKKMVAKQLSFNEMCVDKLSLIQDNLTAVRANLGVYVGGV